MLLRSPGETADGAADTLPPHITTMLAQNARNASILAAALFAF
jgi:hypothetical protein